MITGMGSMFKV